MLEEGCLSGQKDRFRESTRVVLTELPPGVRIPYPPTYIIFYNNRMGSIDTLKNFIDAAETSRKYPSNTATSKRTALNLFEKELKNEEGESLEVFSNNLDKIAQEVFNKNSSSMSASSVETYKRRISSLIKDYEKYGTDPTKMSSWNRPTRKMKKKVVKEKNDNQEISVQPSEVSSIETSRFEVSLRPGVKSIVVVPADITKEEVEKIKKLIDSLVN